MVFRVKLYVKLYVKLVVKLKILFDNQPACFWIVAYIVKWNFSNETCLSNLNIVIFYLLSQPCQLSAVQSFNMPRSAAALPSR